MTAVQPSTPHGDINGERCSAVEIFGHALLDVINCDRGYVALVTRGGRQVVEEVEFGNTALENAALEARCGAAVLESLARHDLRRPVYESVWHGPIAEAVLGTKPHADAQAVFGRIPAEPGKDLVFVAGWRTHRGSNLALVGRSAEAIWTSIRRANGVRNTRAGDALIAHLAYPAFIVDLRLHVHGMNPAGQRLLAGARTLTLDRDALACGDAAADLRLRRVIAALLERNGDPEDGTRVVPLATGSERFAFACVAAVPDPPHGGLALVVVPQLDEAASTRRLSSLFGLNGMEERIVARILEGHQPRRIGELLNLTEATVRTYTKRLMFKLGINHRSDLVRLAFLTTPPLMLSEPGALPGADGPTALADDLSRWPLREGSRPSRPGALQTPPRAADAGSPRRGRGD